MLRQTDRQLAVADRSACNVIFLTKFYKSGNQQTRGKVW